MSKYEDKLKRANVKVIVIRDVIILIAALLVFAYFHHVMPRKGKSQGSTLDTKLPTASAQPSNSGSAYNENEPTPTPAVGDFSVAFNEVMLDPSADYKYEGNNVKIAVNKISEENLTYYVADVYIRTITDFKTAFAKGEYGRGIYENQKKISNNNNAILAMNGDYYGARDSGIVVRNGELYRDSVFSDVCVLYIDGTLVTYSTSEFDVDTHLKNAWQAWSFGPLLMQNGRALTEIDSQIAGRNPRSGIGYVAPGHYVLIVVDGRGENNSRGVSLTEYAALFEAHGCTVAYNLDGGQTSEMIFDGEVINSPYDGGRSCSDIIFFAKDGE